MLCGHCGATHLAEAQQCPRTGRSLDERGPCGQTIDRYQIESLLQAGGFGAVYRGRHVHTRRAVAVKILKAELAADTAMLVRFKREAQAIARIENPHVVQVFDWGVLPTGEAYLAMELLDGQDLRALLASKGALSVDTALAIERQILVGLHAAHACGIVHRDLKPANVFIAGDDKVKLIDFGISKMGGGHDGFRTNTGAAIGTQGYMAPEQIRGTAADERSDVYAAAVVLYEMLTLTTPHPSTSYEDYVLRACTEPPRPIRELVSELPAAVDQAIMRALEREPSCRWSSIAELAQALDGSALASIPARSPPDEVEDQQPPRSSEMPTRAERPAPRPEVGVPPRTRAPLPRWLALGVLAAVAVAGIAIFAIASRNASSREPGGAVLDSAVSLGAPGVDGGTARDGPVLESALAVGAPAVDETAVAPDIAVVEAKPTRTKVTGVKPIGATARGAPKREAGLDAKLAARTCKTKQECPWLMCACEGGKSANVSLCDEFAGRCAQTAAACKSACPSGWMGKVRDAASEPGKQYASSDRDCLESAACAESGRCLMRDHECVKTGCSEVQRCLIHGACSEQAPNLCVWSSDADCARGRRCRLDGQCTLDPASGTCIVGADADCTASTSCIAEGRCRLGMIGSHAYCIAGSDEDCARSTGCKTDGNCQLEPDPPRRRCTR